MRSLELWNLGQTEEWIRYRADDLVAAQQVESLLHMIGERWYCEEPSPRLPTSTEDPSKNYFTKPRLKPIEHQERRALLQALRVGQVTARGRRPDSNQIEPVEAVDWHWMDLIFPSTAALTSNKRPAWLDL